MAWIKKIMTLKTICLYFLIQNEGEKNFEKAQIRISGDGAKISRIANFVVLSFSILEDEESVMSAYGKACLYILT